MWLLRNVANAALCFSLPTGNEITVGRRSCDILLKEDQSVSRKHATFHVEGQNKDAGVFLTDCKSRFGTTVNGARLAGGRVRLAHNDVVQFGQNDTQSQFKLLFEELVFCCSAIASSAEKGRIKQLAGILGGTIVSNWSNSCTHLVMTELTVTVKVVLALATCRPIVSPAWLEAATDSLSGSGPLPPCREHLPPLVDANAQGLGGEAFSPDTRRKNLFEDRVIYFLHRKQYNRLSPCLSSGGGDCRDASVPGGVGLEELVAEDSCVVAVDESSRAQLAPASKGWVDRVSRHLISHQLRFIADSEIGYAFLHISTDVYCNPRIRIATDVSCAHLPPPTLSQAPMSPTPTPTPSLELEQPSHSGTTSVLAVDSVDDPVAWTESHSQRTSRRPAVASGTRPPGRRSKINETIFSQKAPAIDATVLAPDSESSVSPVPDCSLSSRSGPAKVNDTLLANRSHSQSASVLAPDSADVTASRSERVKQAAPGPSVVDETLSAKQASQKPSSSTQGAAPANSRRKPLSSKPYRPKDEIDSLFGDMESIAYEDEEVRSKEPLGFHGDGPPTSPPPMSYDVVDLCDSPPHPSPSPSPSHTRSPSHDIGSVQLSAARSLSSASHSLSKPATTLTAPAKETGPSPTDRDTAAPARTHSPSASVLAPDSRTTGTQDTAGGPKAELPETETMAGLFRSRRGRSKRGREEEGGEGEGSAKRKQKDVGVRVSLAGCGPVEMDAACTVAYDGLSVDAPNTDTHSPRKKPVSGADPTKNESEGVKALEPSATHRERENSTTEEGDGACASGEGDGAIGMTGDPTAGLSTSPLATPHPPPLSPPPHTHHRHPTHSISLPSRSPSSPSSSPSSSSFLSTRRHKRRRDGEATTPTGTGTTPTAADSPRGGGRRVVEHKLELPAASASSSPLMLAIPFTRPDGTRGFATGKRTKTAPKPSPYTFWDPSSSTSGVPIDAGRPEEGEELDEEDKEYVFWEDMMEGRRGRGGGGGGGEWGEEDYRGRYQPVVTDSGFICSRVPPKKVPVVRKFKKVASQLLDDEEQPLPAPKERITSSVVTVERSLVVPPGTHGTRPRPLTSDGVEEEEEEEEGEEGEGEKPKDGLKNFKRFRKAKTAGPVGAIPRFVRLKVFSEYSVGLPDWPVQDADHHPPTAPPTTAVGEGEGEGEGEEEEEEEEDYDPFRF